MSLQDEIAALDRIAASTPYTVEGAQARLAWVWGFGGTAREARAGRVMREAREGNTLHVRARVVLPVRVQTINVNMTIGGDE